jgi:hypothetical protein
VSRDETSLALLGHAVATLGWTNGTRPAGVRLAENDRHLPTPSLAGKVRWLSAASRVGVAAFEALHGSCGADAERTGILVATFAGPADARRRYVEQIRESGRVSPILFTACGHNVAGGLAATALGLRGTNLCFAGEQAGLHALESALLLILERQVDIAYVGRIDPIAAGDPEPWFGAALALGAGKGSGLRLSIRDGGAEILGASGGELARTFALLLGRGTPGELLC